MLKKKLRPGLVSSRQEQGNSKTGLKRRLPPRPTDEDEDEEGQVDEVDEDEEGDEDGEGEEEEAPRKREKVTAGARKGKVLPKKRKGLASAFDRIPLTNNADEVPAGQYEAIVRDVVLQEADSKGQSVRMHFELCDPQFAEANNITQWFKIVDAQGESVDGGIRALKQALAKLGYEPSGEELEECFEEISGDKPGVVLKVSYSKDDSGNTWQRAIIQAPCDNEVVAEYKDNVPY
jgi:hypothetical protein